MSKIVNKANNELKMQLHSLRPCLDRLTKQRYIGKSLRLPFYDMLFGSPLELAAVTVFAHTLEMRIMTNYMDGGKEELHNAISRFRMNNGLGTAATLLRFLARDSVREELINLCIDIAYPHQEGEKNHE